MSHWTEQKVIEDPSKDGITHINIYSKGATELGRFLSNFTKTVINVNGNHFYSVEAYYHYMRAVWAMGLSNIAYSDTGTIEDAISKELTEDNVLKLMRSLTTSHGLNAKCIGADLRHEVQRNGYLYDNNIDSKFGSMMRHAIRTKLIGNNPMLSRLYDNKLPLTHYYNYNGKVISKPHYRWWPSAINIVAIDLLEA